MGKHWAGLLFLSSGFLLFGANPVEMRAGQTAAPTPSAAAEDGGHRDPSRGKWNLWSPEREIALGRTLAEDLERSSLILTDPFVVNYVTEVTERVVRHAEVRMPVVVRVLDSADLDAFTLPGGFLYVTTGMIRETHSEAELAGVIAHEVGHVAARHATRQMTRGELMNWATIPLIFFGGPAAYAVRQGLALTMPLTYLKFSRNAEREADALGLKYMDASGYDPMACVEFFERLRPRKKQKHPGIAGLFSTHPMTSERIRDAEKQIERLPEREEYVLSTSRHDEVLAYLGGRLSDTESGLAGPVLRRRSRPEPAPATSGPWN